MRSKLVVALGVAALLALPALATAQDTWEVLPDVPFTYGVSAGGGLATDGTYVYAADFSGDNGGGNQDYIDLNQDLVDDANEGFDVLGIPNGSVRIARYDPAANTWAAMPAINAAGIGGDSMSMENVNNPMFVVDGKLYYVQFRKGPQRRALYEYDLAQGLAGTWSTVYDVEYYLGTPPIGNPPACNAGVAGGYQVGADIAILYCSPYGGGDYNIGRTDDVFSGTPVVTALTPQWGGGGGQFPRNSGWAYDEINDRLFYVSGDELSQYDHNDTDYAGTLLTDTPDGANDLCLHTKPIPSLYTAFGWSTVGGKGTAEWGTSLTIVNDPSGVSGAGGDTGDNVLYIVRGETTVDGWPFNEGRGLITNGDFGRYYVSGGTSEDLTDAPFNVGKGSSSVYLNGAVYVTQGDTLTLPDNAGNDWPFKDEAIRYPGSGFARYIVKLTEVKGDVDGNGVVNGLDLTAVITAWDTVPGDVLWNEDADLDDNNVVNGLDLTEVISNWTIAAAPEAAASDANAKPGRGTGNVKAKKKK
jgi:hypothetical protein